MKSIRELPIEKATQQRHVRHSKTGKTFEAGMGTRTKNVNTTFSSIMLKNVLKDVEEYCKNHGITFKALKENSWGYKYSRIDTIEFHINKCGSLPEGFYWYGQGQSVTEAKAEGWRAFLDSREGQ
jgi:hypothetical protein